MDKYIAHILVVDDDDGIRSLVKKYLNENMFLVNTAESAEKALDTQIKNDVESIIRPLQNGERLSGDLVRKLLTSKAIFDEQSDALFTAATRSLGKNNEIIPVAPIKQALDDAAKTGSFPGNAPILQEINQAIAKTKQRSMARFGRQISDEEAIKYTYLTPEKAQFLRRVLNDMQYDDAFKVTTANGNLQMLKNSFNDELSIIISFLM